MNRKTALIAIAGPFAVLGILAARVGPSGGNVKSVERIAQSTDRYTEADIHAAFDAIETEFASGFEGCTLDEVRYDGEVETRHLDEISSISKKAKGTSSSCYPNSRPAGGQQTRASRRTTGTRAGNGFSPGPRKALHGRLSTGAIDDVPNDLRNKPGPS